jgi:antibiotic biosynthesis monooxygenase (ABM) superfamily enzyme
VILATDLGVARQFYGDRIGLEVLRLGITIAVTVPLVTWMVMPRVTRLLQRWLYPEHRATELL